MQNLIRIGNVVLKIREFVSVLCEFGLKMPTQDRLGCLG